MYTATFMSDCRQLNLSLLDCRSIFCYWSPIDSTPVGNRASLDKKFDPLYSNVIEQHCSFHNTADRHLVDILTKIKMVSFKSEEVGYKYDEIPGNRRGFVMWQFIRAVSEYAVDRLHKRMMIVPTMIAMTRHVRTKHFLYELYVSIPFHSMYQSDIQNHM